MVVKQIVIKLVVQIILLLIIKLDIFWFILPRSRRVVYGKWDETQRRSGGGEVPNSRANHMGDEPRTDKGWSQWFLGKEDLSGYTNINEYHHYERDRHKKLIIYSIFTWVSPSSIIFKFYCVFISSN